MPASSLISSALEAGDHDLDGVHHHRGAIVGLPQPARAKIIHTRPELAFLLARLIGYAVKDVVITREEIRGLMSNLLVSASQPTAPTRFSEWLSKNADGVGIRYISGLERRYR